MIECAPGLFKDNVNLGINGFTYADLYDYGLSATSPMEFDRFVENATRLLRNRFESYRIAMHSGIAAGGPTSPEESALLIAMARELGVFSPQLFGSRGGVWGAGDEGAARCAGREVQERVRDEARREGQNVTAIRRASRSSTRRLE